MKKRKYSQLDSLTASRSAEISRLIEVVRNLEQRMESIEEGRCDLLHKVSSLNAKVGSANRKCGQIPRYACHMCVAKFRDSKHLQLHRKNAHKAHYNI